MNVVKWNELDSAAQSAAIARGTVAAGPEVRSSVEQTLVLVKTGGDAAVRDLTERFDGVRRESLSVSADEVWPRLSRCAQSCGPRSPRLLDGSAHSTRLAWLRTTPLRRLPAWCERVVRPIPRVGLYVPAGSAPLPSTALMLGIPAQLAGCPEVVLITPPGPCGAPDAAVLAAAAECGITEIVVAGGAQAIAALAYGTETVPRCDKIYGPGNAWVTEAKRQVSTAEGGPGIDMPAGPSEVVVIADAGATAEFVAADLLSQAEHGPDSQVILFTNDDDLAGAVIDEVLTQVEELPRADIARKALASSRVIVTRDLAQAFEISNEYGPEHLILSLREPRDWLAHVRTAGSVFLGDWAPETLGDYCSGTNHVLPTAGAARYTGGVNVASFQIAMTVQSVTPAGLQEVGPCAVELSEAEQLHAHQRAVTKRLARLESES
ncbi:histidinol dehydrogenase [Ornithinimicrobium sp. INDO-MA30-4]|uniref:histidinol dehydrogenase n=1 Tax=Ornithinimicrobium sp. INDO-MA30-4 TaxID=2908651 RepID=UPI001F17FD95|nr:histidinol dehydrogenase [Ornithinimicrobium sp. INDO-MA30-4]UJH71151.1 histidinol dehydrogenase [Ornithinimicrobium sp. INDO-MA30-4]